MNGTLDGRLSRSASPFHVIGQSMWMAMMRMMALRQSVTKLAASNENRRETEEAAQLEECPMMARPSRHFLGPTRCSPVALANLPG